MGKLKVDLVNRAYDWLRISGLTSNPLPEEVAIALDIQENMMYEFQSRNICSSWVFEECPDPNTDSIMKPCSDIKLFTRFIYSSIFVFILYIRYFLALESRKCLKIRK